MYRILLQRPHRASRCPGVQTPSPETFPLTRSALDAGFAAGSGSADLDRQQQLS